jgi:hypothetical protein
MLRLLLINLALSHFCQLEKPSIQYLKGRNLRTSIIREDSWGKMRFHVDWSQLSSSDKQKYEKYIDSAFVYFSNALKVHQISSSSSWDDLFSSDPNCTIIKEKYSNKNISGTDMIILIDSEFDYSKIYIGYSITCAYDPSTFQPIATYLKVNKAYMESSVDNEESLIMLFIHEVSHSLGFSYEDMQNFRKIDGTSYETSELFTDISIRGLPPQRFLSTPKVKELARKAFDCPTLPGVQLESQGSERIALNHWDKRMMFTDYMNPQVLTDNIVYSDITLAVFEDSGWYLPNYTLGNSINFGFQAGCDFINKKCIFKQTAISSEFCFPDDIQGPFGKGRANTGTFCDFSLLNYGKCDVFDMGFAIPTEYQYFSQDSLGGDTFCDFCPVNSKIFNCRGISSPDIDSGEELGLDSRCFEGTLSISVSGLNSFASCHRVKCFDEYFVVFLGNQNATCAVGTKNIEFQGFYGNLACPEYEKVCKSPPCKANCYGGTCVNGRCLNGGDKTGFKGESYPDGKTFPCYSECGTSGGGAESSENNGTKENNTESDNETNSFSIIFSTSLLFIM